MTHGRSSRIALTVSVVIAGAPGAETSTGRPNLPRVSLAARGDLRSNISRCPSSVTSTLSPGRRFKALRYWVGMTSCPLVDRVDKLIVMSYTSYHDKKRLRPEERNASTILTCIGDFNCEYRFCAPTLPRIGVGVGT